MQQRSAEHIQGAGGPGTERGRWCSVLNKANSPVYPTQLRPHKLRWRWGATTTTKNGKKNKKSLIITTRPGGKPLIHFLFPQLNFKIKLLRDRLCPTSSSLVAPLINILKPYVSNCATHSVFIAAFGKNNSQMHYRPVGAIDAADKVAAFKVASPRLQEKPTNMQNGP